MPVIDAILAVEGSHDAAFVGRLLKAGGYNQVTKPNDLPDEWKKLYSPQYPKPGSDLNQPHSVPHYWKMNSGELVTIMRAGGDSKLAGVLDRAWVSIGRFPAAVGCILDDDREPNPINRHNNLRAAIAHEEAASSLGFPDLPGTTSIGPPRTGIFVLPNNLHPGTLDDVLLEAAKVPYFNLIAQAESYVEHFDETGLNATDTQEGRKNSGRKKRKVASMVAILKPTRALATSLQDNRWLEGDALQQPLVFGFRRWLHELLDLPPIAL